MVSTLSGSLALESLLYHTEFFLRRQLQQAPTTESDVVSTDPYDYAQPTTGEAPQSRGRTVLTVLYLCVLGLCFLVPVLYYFRLHCFEENARRELELDFTTAVEQSEQYREESRAARRKYIEERRARIVQLMMPVRLVLKPDNFPHPMNTVVQQEEQQQSVSLLNLDFDSEKYRFGKTASEDCLSDNISHDDVSAHDDNNKRNRTKNKHNNSNLEQGIVETYPEDNDETNPYGEEDTLMVRIPVAGLPMGGSFVLDPTRPQRQLQDNAERKMRLVPGLCTVCLSNYKVGSDIVWSSNEACEHHFHANCIEKWLMKQREGPLCPICRRDFIVDPLDLLEEEDHVASSQDRAFLWELTQNVGDDEYENYDAALQHRMGPLVVMAGDLRNNSGTDGNTTPSQMEEGLHLPASGENNDESDNNNSSTTTTAATTNINQSEAS